MAVEFTFTGSGFKLRIRNIWHYIAGFVAGIIGAWCWGAPVAGTIAFMVYEIKQDVDTGSVSYLDIQEFCIGLFIGCACIIPLKVLGVA